MDSYQQMAVNLMTSPKTREAFDLSQASRRRFANATGCMPGVSGALLARRLVEAGCSFVTMVMENPFVSGLKSPKLGFYNWDSHAVNCDCGWTPGIAFRSTTRP